MVSLATTATPTITTIDNDGAIVSGLLQRRVGKAEVLKGGVLHLRSRQYDVVSHGIGVAQLVVGIKEKRRALDLIELGNLSKTAFGAAVARPPGEQDRRPEAHKTLSLHSGSIG